ncbi:MAG: HEAT repeat domain-containing protein, partial [Candidatus Kryptonium sp.]
EALRKISSDWFRSEEVKSQISDLIVALRSRDRGVRVEVVKVLGEIGDARAVDALVSVLGDENSDVRKSALEALEMIEEKCAPLLSFYPNLVCRKDHTRAEVRKVHVNTFTKRVYVSCRVCGSSLSLVKGIKEVVGLIGGDVEDYVVDLDRYYVSLWDEVRKEARNADIDVLEIREASYALDYEWAIEAVCNILKNDLHKPRNYLKRVPVIIRNNLKLSDGIMKILKSEFKEIIIK